MKAAIIEEHGNIDYLKVGQIEVPKINPNEILIETKYSALNHIDLFVIKGWPALDLPLPHVIGSDGSGIIKEVGRDITLFDEGDRVAINPGLSCGKCFFCLSGKQNFCKQFSILGEHQWGTFSEYFKIPEFNVIKIPDNFKLDLAAAAPLTFLTAWRMLNTQAKLKAEEYIFIHGAGGGVSTAAIQIAKHLGANVITSTSSKEKMEKALKLGADHVINYVENPEYSKSIYTEITHKKGVDVVIDSVGKDTFQNSIQLLKPGGRLVIPGATTGPISEVDLRQIFWKQLKVIGSTMSNQKEFREVMDLIFLNKFRPVIDKIFPLEKITEAEQYLSKHQQFGKIVLRI
ncbi:MAG: zinc-binding dehydrogenase [Candidatus Lokiarchaeota archaeon]|jgi:NADPH:quinone reductase-like Zn-dependent oxidoreductase